jgi:hypothetical protein
MDEDVHGSHHNKSISSFKETLHPHNAGNHSLNTKLTLLDKEDRGYTMILDEIESHRSNVSTM